MHKLSNMLRLILLGLLKPLLSAGSDFLCDQTVVGPGTFRIYKSTVESSPSADRVLTLLTYTGVLTWV